MLNTDQANADKIIRVWQLSCQKNLILEGKAGTGKSYFLSKTIPKIAKFPLFIAPTNEAVNVLQESIIHPKAVFKTVYSALGYAFETKDHKKVLKKVNKNTKFDYDLIIVDESSMLEDFLLKELLAERRKILFVGHSSQLPPISTGDYTSLTDKCISPVFLKGFDQISLKQQMRNTTEIYNFCLELEKPILDSTQRFKETNWKDFFCSSTWLNSHIDIDSFFNEKSRIICWTNETVDKYNSFIRSLIFGTKSDRVYLPGDKILLTSPAVFYGNLSSKTTRRMLENSAKKDTVVSFQTNTRFVVKNVFDISLFQIPCWGLDVYKDKQIYTIYVPKDLDSLEKAKEQLIRDSFSMKREQKDKHFKWYHIFVDLFANVKHSYAITTHRSQGTTIDNVIVHWGDIHKVPNTYLRNKLLYVACSRAKESLKCAI